MNIETLESELKAIEREIKTLEARKKEIKRELILLKYPFEIGETVNCRGRGKCVIEDIAGTQAVVRKIKKDGAPSLQQLRPVSLSRLSKIKQPS